MYTSFGLFFLRLMKWYGMTVCTKVYIWSIGQILAKSSCFVHCVSTSPGMWTSLLE